MHLHVWSIGFSARPVHQITNTDIFFLRASIVEVKLSFQRQFMFFDSFNKKNTIILVLVSGPVPFEKQFDYTIL